MSVALGLSGPCREVAPGSWQGWASWSGLCHPRRPHQVCRDRGRPPTQGRAPCGQRLVSEELCHPLGPGASPGTAPAHSCPGFSPQQLESRLTGVVERGLRRAMGRGVLLQFPPQGCGCTRPAGGSAVPIPGGGHLFGNCKVRPSNLRSHLGSVHGEGW